jgi:hypothetical protein
MEHLQIKDKVFNIHLDFFYDCEFNEIPIEDKWEAKWYGRFLHFPDWSNLIWVEDVDDITAITHELLHFTFENLKNLWVEYCSESEEVFCYLQQYFLKEILQKTLK